QNREIHGNFEAYLLEATIRASQRGLVYTRAESVDKDILDVGFHPRGTFHRHRHSQVGALTLGYLYEFLRSEAGNFGVGADVTRYAVPENLQEPYGSPTSYHCSCITRCTATSHISARQQPLPRWGIARDTEHRVCRRSAGPGDKRPIGQRGDYGVRATLLGDRFPRKANGVAVINGPSRDHDSPCTCELLVPGNGDLPRRPDGDLRMSRGAFSWNSLPLRESLSIARRGVEQCQALGAPRVVNEGRPHDVDTIALVHGDRRAIFGTSVQHPVVFADADRWREGSSTIRGLRQRDVADVARIDVTPRRDNAAVCACGERRLAAITDAMSDRPCACRVTQPGEEDLRELRGCGAIGLVLHGRPVLVFTARAGAGRPCGHLAVVEPHGHRFTPGANRQ